jgi:hypothetical protein
MFRFIFQGDPLRRATKSMAKGSLFGGLILIGLGLLVWVLKEIFAIIAMIIFFMAGFSAIGYSIRLFIAQYRMKKRGDTYPTITDASFEDR